MARRARTTRPISPEIIADVRRRQRAKKPNVRTALDFIIENAGHDGGECLIWPYTRHPVGYGLVGFGGRLTYAHRVMCAAAHGAPPSDDRVTAHSCGNGYGGCVNPNHLRWATQAENLSDKIAHGKHRSGHGHYKSALNPDQVEKAKTAVLSKRGDLARLAFDLGVSHATILRVRNGESYRSA